MTANENTRAPRELVICFLDLSTFTKDARRADDARVADIIDGYYERVAAHAARGGGRCVKFIGDGALLVFPPERADDAVLALLALKSDVDAWLAEERWDSRLVVKAHCDAVIAGDFGARDDKRFDIIGNAVNVAARLETRSFALSPQVFRRLSVDVRRRFKKHTPPMTYIPIEDRHS
jgi:adenylate cyclase